MMKISSFIFFFILSVNISFAQKDKYTKNLSDYKISIVFDTSKWKRMSYEEMNKIYKSFNVDFDEYLNSQKGIALFDYTIKDTAAFPQSFTVRIKVTDQITTETLLGHADTFNARSPFLKNLDGEVVEDPTINEKYFDKRTGSLIKKSSIPYLAADTNPEKPDRLWAITQQKKIDNWYITVEFTCLQKHEPIYFPLFEEIIMSFK